MLVFDCETGPVDDDQLIPLLPEFTPPPPPPADFDPASVKTGNLKDKAKIDEKIAAARDAHTMAVANYPAAVETARANHLADFRSKAALSPLTGRVLAIGFRDVSSGRFAIEDGGGDEEELLGRFWAKYAKCRGGSVQPRKMAGWNIVGFDLPFLIRRSWLHHVDIVRSVYDGRNFDQLFVDLMQQFTPGGWREFVSLDTAAKFLRCGAKPDGVKGEDFARLWAGSQEEKQKAILYLQNDLEMTAAICQRMGIAA